MVGAAGVEHQELFGKGSLVEVGSDEDGFKGAWYIASVIDTPSGSSSSASKKKNPNSDNYFVQYQSLLDDDGVTPLREYAKPEFVRPLPPPASDLVHSFGLNDVVDAFYRDGWWTGVINRVLHNSRFLVTFQSPPDEIEFGLTDLRVHREWVDGKWIRRGKQGIFISPDHQEQVKCGCISAGNTQMPVQLANSSGTKDKSEEKTPCSLNSGEDQSQQSTPCRGKPSSDGMVSLRKKTKQKNLDNDASHCSPLKKLKEGNALETLSLNTLELDVMPILTCEEDHFGISTAGFGDAGTNCPGQSVDGDQPTATTQSHSSGKDTNQLKGGDNGPKKRRGRPPKLLQRQSVAIVTGPGSKKLSAGLTRGKNVSSKTIKTCPAKKCELPNGSILQASRKQLEKASSRSGGKPSSSLNTGSPIEDSEHATQERRDGGFEVGMAIDELHSRASDDQPLSTWFEGMHPLTTIEGSSVSLDRKAYQCTETSGGHRKIETQSAVADGNGNIVPDLNQSLPFVKTSPLWETIESMEAFKLMPQQPHFHPLGSCKESSREGLAIGCMVTFSSMVKKASEMHFDDPRNSFEDSLETLLELERHGFDVRMVRDRFNGLLQIKDRQKHLQDQSEELGRQIMELGHEKTKIDEEIDEINKKIRELHDKLELATSMENIKHSEIASLQSSRNTIIEAIKSIKIDFEKEVVAPW